MTRVVLDARGITARPAGVARYAISLVPRLIAQRPEWDWVVLRHASNKDPLVPDGIPQIYADTPIDSARNLLTGAALVRSAVRKHGPVDLYHSLFQVIPRGLPTRLRVAVTAHDFIDMDHPAEVRANPVEAARLAAYARSAFPFAMRRADRIVAISEFTAERARALSHPTKVVVVPHGVEDRFFELPPPADAIVDFLTADRWRYVVAVGNDKPYKNLLTLIRAFAHAGLERTRLAIVGSCERLRGAAEALGIEDRVSFLGFLGDLDLRRLLGHAEAFVFPSTLEGFGMPPLEAMAMGVPTVVSDLEPMRSVAGDAAIRFSATDVYALAEILRLLSRDVALREAMRQSGRRWARGFSWDETARQTLSSYLL